MPKSLASAENWLNCQEKASFELILTKPIEPIFQSAGPILDHIALRGNTGSKPLYMKRHIHVKTRPSIF